MLRLPPSSDRVPPYEAPVLLLKVEAAMLMVDDMARSTKLASDTTLPAEFTASTGHQHASGDG